ncbi:hypothetical protein EI74_0482 [Mycoplasma testudineum]|uniref:Uncharacterized protein n=1 Tax=Mycoplasma testudineum TaxID=244584 RepID=A0A4R6IEJ6_9MOLU|nr:hypothetical protein [Mycoplasma testudineum]OYD26869.1 hypothetical protein CG473_02030 [Mycoplasma testudineum]TDO20404.1 hypothetical protein EI74_0482 [Mycoplasma testudineum]
MQFSYVFVGFVIAVLITLAVVTIIEVQKIYRNNIFGVTNIVLDLENDRVRKVMLTPFNYGSYEQKKHNENFSKGAWVSIKEFIKSDIFNEKERVEISKIIQQAKNNVLDKTQLLETNGITQTHKISKAIHNLTFSPVTTLRIRFKSISNKKMMASLYWSKNREIEKKVANNRITISDLLTQKTAFKNFIGLKIVPSKEKKLEILVKRLETEFSNKINIFYDNSILFVELQNNDQQKLKKQTNTVLNQIQNGKSNWFYNSFIELLSIVEMADVKYEDDIANLKLRMEYGLYESKVSGKIYRFELDAINISRYESFKNQVKILNRAMQTYKIGTNLKKIYQFPSHNPISNKLASPKVLEEMDTSKINILLSEIYADQLEAKFIEALENNYDSQTKLFVELSFKNFIEHAQKLVSQKISYFVKVTSNNQLFQISEYLKTQNLKLLFGVKINKYHEDFFDFISTNDVAFVFVGEKIGANITNEEMFLKTAYLNQITQERKIKTIIEKVPKNLEENIIKKAGIQYYY